MSFERSRELMKLVHINVRGEKHGDEDETAVDLRFREDFSNDVLSEFSSTLKSSLYQRQETPQQDFDPATVPLTVVKNPQMGSIKWAEKYDCARVVVHHGVDDRSDIVFGIAKVNKFIFLPKQGGTVEIQFLVQVHPDPVQSGLLLAVLNQEVYVTVESDGGEPEEDEQADFGAAGNEGFAPPIDGTVKDFGPAEDEDDEFFKPAMEHVIREQKVSVSIIQKLCHVGFNRASRLVERMESQGIVSAEDGKGKRTVLIPADMLADQQAAAGA